MAALPQCTAVCWRAAFEVAVITSEVASHQVLVVEDDPALREIYAGALRGYGHDVRTAGDGAEALHRLENGWEPCVVFLDLRQFQHHSFPGFARRRLEELDEEAQPLHTVDLKLADVRVTTCGLPV